MKTPKTSKKRIALVAGLILGGGAWLHAQPSQYQTDQPDRASEIKKADQPAISQSGQPTKVNKGSSLIGTTVKNQQGEDLGKIRDLVIDFESGRVAYVVLASDSGVLSAEKLHAVPLRAFKPDAAGTSLVLNADKAKLESTAGFDKNNWPALGTATMGAEPFWKDDTDRSIRPDSSSKDQYKTKTERDRLNNPTR